MVAPANRTPGRTPLRRRQTSPFRFNPNLGSTGRYIDAQGRMVPVRDVIAQTERAIQGAKGEMREVSERLISGEITIQRWYTEMRNLVKTIHGLTASVAKGGWAQMTMADWGRVGAITKREYRYLENFAADILSGKQALNDGLLFRAEMYSGAARGTAEEVARQVAASKFKEERRVLGVADHCTTRGGKTGCLELAQMGWQPINTLPRIGDAPCLTFCHCHFIYR